MNEVENSEAIKSAMKVFGESLKKIADDVVNYQYAYKDVTEMVGACEDVAVLPFIPSDEQRIDQLKKQIKYSKNPLEVKMLNKKLNRMYKSMKS